MAEYKHIIILKEILQNGGYYMVLIKNHGSCDGFCSGGGDAGCVLDRIFGR